MNDLTTDELDLLIDLLMQGMPAVEKGTGPEELKRWKVDRMRALLRKLKARKKTAMSEMPKGTQAPSRTI